MEIYPVAFDSLGTRSMCTWVETEDMSILIDPGVALGPRRYGLPPHKSELERLEEHIQEIRKFAIESDVFIITHYHYDHHIPEMVDIFKDRDVLIKHPAEKINKSQRVRAAFFLERLKNLADHVKYADGEEIRCGKTTIRFSDPVYHGTNPKLGYVIEISITSQGETLVFTSDVEGPSLKPQVNFILQEKPDYLIVDGPMTYMLGYRYSSTSLEASVQNLIEIINTTAPSVMVLDHHLVRDLGFEKHIFPIRTAGEEQGVRVLTAAELAGKKPDFLEARRKELYDKS